MTKQAISKFPALFQLIILSVKTGLVNTYLAMLNLQRSSYRTQIQICRLILYLCVFSPIHMRFFFWYIFVSYIYICSVLFYLCLLWLFMLTRSIVYMLCVLIAPFLYISAFLICIWFSYTLLFVFNLCKCRNYFTYVSCAFLRNSVNWQNLLSVGTNIRM